MSGNEAEESISNAHGPVEEQGSTYKFTLRNDMPPGFQHNEVFPELPAMLNYLLQYNGMMFETVDQFRETVLKPFPQYLKDKEVPCGADHFLRKGLHVAELPESAAVDERTEYTHVVYARTSGLPGSCEFGGLELLTK